MGPARRILIAAVSRVPIPAVSRVPIPAVSRARVAAPFGVVIATARAAVIGAALTATIGMALAALIGVALATTACRRGGDPAAEAVRSLVRAANRRDAGTIVAALAPDFQGSFGMSREDVDAELRRLFAAYASVDVSLSDLATERYPEFTLARFHVDFRGSVRRIGGLEGILPASARYRFELRLVPEGGAFRVASAHWEELGTEGR